MPELPEVETTRLALQHYLLGRTVTDVIIRNPNLRWKLDRDLANMLLGAKLEEIQRRGKYLILRFSHGNLIVHLGMSGSLRIVSAAPSHQKHDHVDICLSKLCLRYTDPRRFGSMHWVAGDPLSHWLLSGLGAEPLSRNFNAQYLMQHASSRRTTIKSVIMDAKIVVGVGNIYANEALFMACIHPLRLANQINAAEIAQLCRSIKKVLRLAIKMGGTTLRDFVSGHNRPGYFQNQLQVYGKDGQPCQRCRSLIITSVMHQRTSYYCPHCQV